MNTSYLPLVFALVLLILTSFTPGIGYHQKSADLGVTINSAVLPEISEDKRGGDKILPDSYSPNKESAEEPSSESLKNSSLFSSPPINTYPLRDWGVPNPEIDVTAALIKDLESGYIFWNKESQRRWPIASLTKLMTATIVLEEMSASQNNANNKTDKSTDDLLKMMLVASDNEAANALAEKYFNKDEFIRAMQRKAQELKMTQTTFFDPSGLAVSNQSTPNDLVILVNYILKTHPEILKITAQKSYQGIQNTNLFAGRPDFIGGKTGFLDEAGGNLISIFKYREGKSNFPLLVIILGSKDRFGDTQLLLDWVKKAYEF